MIIPFRITSHNSFSKGDSFAKTVRNVDLPEKEEMCGRPTWLLSALLTSTSADELPVAQWIDSREVDVGIDRSKNGTQRHQHNEDDEPHEHFVAMCRYVYEVM